MMQCADLVFSLLVSNGTVSQMLLHTVSASLAELNATQHNVKGNGVHMQTNAMQKYGISFSMKYSEMFSLQKGNS